MLTEKILRKMKTFGFVAFKFIRVLQNIARLLCLIVEGLNSGFPKQNVHVHLVLCCEMSYHVDIVYASVLLVCVYWDEPMFRALCFAYLLS